MSLASQYVTTKTTKKKDFNKEEIMDALMASPLNIDINLIFETPITVGVRMPRKEYIEKNGAISQKSMGLVIKYVKENLKNVDGALAAKIVKSNIS